jgi:ATP-dependent Clp protease protease subunit
MSAGVLLLAAGTKGKRKIGKNCRVMIHSVIGGNVGPLHNLENEMNEIRYIQNAYLKALADETNMTYQQLRRMINRKVNVYLSAEEAVKLGIADIIV